MCVHFVLQQEETAKQELNITEEMDLEQVCTTLNYIYSACMSLFIMKPLI